MNNLRIRTKLVASFIVVALIAGLIGYLGISNMKILDEADTRMYENTAKPLGYTVDIVNYFQRIRVNLRDAMISADANEVEKYSERIDEIKKLWEEAFTKYETTIIDAQDKKNFEAIKEAKTAYFKDIPSYMALVKTNKDSIAQILLRGQMQVANENVQKAIDVLVDYNVATAKEISDANTKLYESSRNVLLILILIAIILSIVLGLVIATNIQNIIKSVVKQTKDLVDAAIAGKLATRAKPEETNEEFREIVIGVNKTLDAVIGPLNVAAEYVDRISKGNIPPKITDTYNGDFNEIKNNLNVCIDAVNSLVTDAGMLAKAGIEGKLATRADASKHGGDFGKIVDGVNKTLDAVIGPLNVAAEYVDRISKGNIPPKITDTYNGDFNEIKNNLNVCIDAVNLLVTDAAMLARAAVEGKLATRADASKHDGDFRKVVDGVNKTLDAVIGPLNVAAEYVDRISKGNIPPKISDTYNGDFNEIKNNLNMCIDAVNLLVADAAMLSRAAVEGKLATRADASKHGGDFGKIVEGVNKTLDAVIGPLNVAAEYVDRISKGNIPPKITDSYNGDFNEIKNNLNVCIDAVNLLVGDAAMLSRAAVEGKLATRADASKHGGDFGKVVDGVNKTLDAVIGPLNVAAEYVDRISKGNIPAKITDTYNGDFNEIKNNLNVCIDAVNLLVGDAAMLVKAAVEGKLATRADASKHDGDFKRIVEGVNNTLDSVIGPLNVAANYVDSISRGDIPKKISDNYNGDFNLIKNNLNQCIDAVNLLVADANMLSKAAVEGKLATRADATKHWGDFRKIVEGVNNTLDSVVNPLNVAAEYVSRISVGDMPTLITEHYNGDFNTIKNNLNFQIDSMNQIIEKAKMVANGDLTVELKKRSEKDDLMQALSDMVKAIAYVMGEVKSATESVALSSQEMTTTTQDMSQGATEQASAAEEVTSSMEEMVANIQQNTDNAQQTERIALKAAADIAEGSSAVEKTVESMKNIAEKITIVSDIADKIDLLAINAAIEAARAGEHGKGFAVVAAEVRKLAERSLLAAKEINDVSSSSVSIAEKSGKLLVQIVPDIQKTARLVQEISAASLEQNSGAVQINNAIQQLNQVTQQNAASAEEISSSAEELASMSEQLKEVISFFKLTQEFQKNITQQRGMGRKSTKSVTPAKQVVAHKGITLNLGKHDNVDNEYENM